MYKRFGEITRQYAIQILLIVSVIFAPFDFIGSRPIALAIANSGKVEVGELPAGSESYLDRADILDLPAQHHNLGVSWEHLKAAHFSFVAELLALYSADTHFYFMARDAEYLYDVARLITAGTDESQRIHLLNVSRANMSDPNLKAFLKENGIEDQLIRKGKKAVLVDTGFSGTLSRVIGEQLSETGRPKLKTHLIVSSNPEHPSSRAFLIHLNPSVNSEMVANMHGTIVNYEYMPRSTDRSYQFVFSRGRYHPISKIGEGRGDGTVSKEQSLQYRTDLKFFWQRPETKVRFQFEREQLEKVKSHLASATEDSNMWLKAKLDELRDTAAGRLFEAQIRDVIEAQVNTGFRAAVTLNDLGLKFQPRANVSKKIELIEKFPDWAPILENPEDQIPKLFQQKNWQMIGNLIDADVDIEINKLISKSLYDSPAVGIKKDLQILMLEKGNLQMLEEFTKNTFTQPHAKDMSDLIRRLIETGGVKAWRSFAENTFSNPHTKDMTDLIQLLIEKGDADTWRLLAGRVFSKPHAEHMTALIRLLIERGDVHTLHHLVTSTFSQPHTKGMSQLLELVLQNGNPQTWSFAAVHTFSQPHTKDMTALLRYLIQKNDAPTMHRLGVEVFSKPHTKTPEHEVLRQSLQITDPEKREVWIEAELAKLKSPLANISAVSPLLQPQALVVINGRTLKVIKKAGEGRRGIVFQVQALDNNAFYALKVAKRSDETTLASFAKESSKAAEWQRLGIPHSKVLAQEKTYVLKTWIDGTSGEEIVAKYRAGDQSYRGAIESAKALTDKVRSQGAYIGDFRPANLVWTGKAWVMVDSGGITQKNSVSEAHELWSKPDERGPKFERRWGVPLPPVEHVKCQALFTEV